MPEKQRGIKPLSGNLWAYAKQYVQDLQVRHYSPDTLRNRKWYLNLFCAWCLERELGEPEQIDIAILESYQRHLFGHRKPTGQPLSIRTQARILSAIKLYFKWLCKRRYLRINPASELELPRDEKRLPKPALTLLEAETVLNTLNIKTPLGLRDRALLEVLLSTGLRRMEVCGLDLSDIDYQRGTVYVREGKGKKDRYIPIGERALWWLNLYLEQSRPRLLVHIDEKALFLNARGNAFDREYLSEKVRDIVKKSGIDKSGSCHLFRHTMATLLLEAGADTRYIQGMLGHADLNSTQIYTQLSAHKLKEIHTLYHPAKLRGKRGNGSGENTQSEQSSDS